MVDPAQIELTAEQRRRLAQLAERSGKDWTEIVNDWLNSNSSRPLPAAAKSNGERTPEKSLYDILSERGILGCFDGPTDLSTNPKHMEGFGESRDAKNSH
jgi:hypothetical protein